MNTNEILSKVRLIEIKARGLSNQIFSGTYHSAFKGSGIAFTEVREYTYGDDIRSIDWKVTARYNHPYVKVFEEERELTVILLIDASGSNRFGSLNQLKKDLITEVAAVLSFSAILNNDKVGVIFFSDKIEKFIPPKKGSSHVLRIIRELLFFTPENQATNIASALEFLNNTIKKRSIVFLMSDFMDKGYEKPFTITKQKHDLVALHICDPNEQKLPELGFASIFNPETNKINFIDFSNKEVKKAYYNWYNQLNNYMIDIFTKTGTDYTTLYTNQDYVKPMVKLFKQREKRM